MIDTKCLHPAKHESGISVTVSVTTTRRASNGTSAIGLSSISSISTVRLASRSTRLPFHVMVALSSSTVSVADIACLLSLTIKMPLQVVRTPAQTPTNAMGGWRHDMNDVSNGMPRIVRSTR